MSATMMQFGEMVTGKVRMLCPDYFFRNRTDPEDPERSTKSAGFPITAALLLGAAGSLLAVSLWTSGTLERRRLNGQYHLEISKSVISKTEDLIKALKSVDTDIVVGQGNDVLTVNGIPEKLCQAEIILNIARIPFTRRTWVTFTVQENGGTVICPQLLRVSEFKDDWQQSAAPVEFTTIHNTEERTWKVRKGKEGKEVMWKDDHDYRFYAKQVTKTEWRVVVVEVTEDGLLEQVDERLRTKVFGALGFDDEHELFFVRELEKGTLLTLRKAEKPKEGGILTVVTDK